MTIWNDLIKLLRFQFLLLARDFQISDPQRNQGKSNVKWSIIALGLLAIIIFRISYSFVFGLRNIFPETQGQFENVLYLELHLLSLSAMLLFVILVLNGIRIVYENYFESRDLQFLLTLPVSVSAIFTSKFIKSVAVNFIYVIPFLGSLWIGYGFGTGGGMLYYLTVFVVLICGTVIFTAVTTIVILLIARFIPSLIMKQAITIGSFLLAFAVFVTWQYFAVVADIDISPENIMAMAENLQPVLEVNLPHLWMANSLVWAEGNLSITLWESVIPLIASAVISFVVSIIFARQVFVTGWSKSRDVHGKQLQTRTKVKNISNNKNAYRLAGIIKKDLLILRRAPFIWYNVLIFIAMLGLITFNMAGGVMEEPQSIFNIESSLSLMLIGIFGTQAGGNIAGVAFSIEGRALWIMGTAPISKQKLYLMKLYSGVFTNFIIMLIAFIVFRSLPGVAVYPWYLSIPILFGKAVAVTSAILYMDISNPNFELGDKLNQIGGDSNIKGQFRSVSSIIIQLIITLMLGILILVTGVFQSWWWILLLLLFFIVIILAITRYCYKNAVEMLGRYLIE